MDIIKNLLRLLYRIRWYLIIIPMIVVIIVWFLTRKQDSLYNVDTTIYTGIISGYSIEGSVSRNSTTNMANLLLIIRTEKTIRNVSLRLLALCLMNGSEEYDSPYITAEHYRQLKALIPDKVRAGVDKRDVKKTVKYLESYCNNPSSSDNAVYALLSHHEYFGVPDIESHLTVIQMSGSDMIRIGYSSNDAGIAYYTLVILNEEFNNEYQKIRFGETNKVIKFFEQEVSRLYRILCKLEEDLIDYNVDHRIINYGEQTKQVAIMDASHKVRDNDQLLATRSTKAVVDFMEEQLGDRINLIKNNIDFTQSLEQISVLKSRVTNLELMDEENNEQTKDALARARRDLEKAEQRTRAITEAIARDMTGEKGVKKNILLEQWLSSLIKYKEIEAEKQAMDILHGKVDEDLKYFSPIGANLARKERRIGFIEGNYMEMLKALNAARLRQRNLQMSTASLRVLNPPMYPLNSAPSNRLFVLLVSWLVSTFLVAAYFYLIELLDRTLRDRYRTESLTKCPVLGCYPMDSNLRYRKYNKIISDMALRHLSTSLLRHINSDHRNIINILSTNEGNGKSFIANELDDMWTSLGLQVRRLTYDEDFLTDDRRYVMASSINELCPELQDDEIVIVEYPALDGYEVPSALINEATVNIIVSRANRTWKDIDQKALDRLLGVMKNKDSLYFYLTEAGRDAVEEFVGQLPPYTPIKNFVYRISQLGLTAVEYNNRK